MIIEATINRIHSYTTCKNNNDIIHRRYVHVAHKILHNKRVTHKSVQDNKWYAKITQNVRQSSVLGTPKNPNVTQHEPQWAPMWSQVAPIASPEDHLMVSNGQLMTIWIPGSHKIEALEKSRFWGESHLDESIDNYHVIFMSQRCGGTFCFSCFPGILGLPIY